MFPVSPSRLPWYPSHSFARSLTVAGSHVSIQGPLLLAASQPFKWAHRQVYAAGTPASHPHQVHLQRRHGSHPGFPGLPSLLPQTSSCNGRGQHTAACRGSAAAERCQKGLPRHTE